MSGFFNNKSQMNFIILLASIIGIYLSSSWTYNEIVVVKTLWENDMDISWFIYIPLIVFFLAILLISLLLFIGSILEFKLKDFLQNSQFKQILVLTIIFNLIIVILTLLNEYLLKIQNNDFSGGLVFTILVLLYIFGARKKDINPFYFLVILGILSFCFWYLIYLIF